MSAEKLIGRALENPIGLAVGAAVVVGLVYYLARKTVTDVAEGVSGVLTGNNSMTQGTAYEGKGVIGTVGAATNAVSGGLFQSMGEWVGGTIYDLLHPYDPNTPSQTNILYANSDRDGKPSSIR